MFAMNPRDSGLHCFRRLPEQLWTLRKQTAGDVQIYFRVPRRPAPYWVSTQTNLGKNPLSGQEFSAQSNDETHHCEAAIPLLGEGREAEFCVVHGIECEHDQLWQIVEGCCETSEPVLGADLTTWSLQGLWWPGAVSSLHFIALPSVEILESKKSSDHRLIGEVVLLNGSQRSAPTHGTDWWEDGIDSDWLTDRPDRRKGK